MHMLNTFRPRIQIPALLASAVLLASVSVALASASSSGASTSSRHSAHQASSYLTGIGDEQTEMFTNPLWQQLHTKIARYIVPYDAATRPYSLTLATQWIQAAEAQHQQILVAFYHSEYTATKMPSLSTYQKDVQRFVKLFPKVRQYQPWNEANRGNVAHMFDSPSATESAKYYKALKSVCKGCTVLGLDILDGQSISPSLRYVASFKREIQHLKVAMPSVWGLHNYSDTNRFSSTRTRAILAAVPGQVWLTETGGVVQFGKSFPNKKGSGLTRASKALTYMFKLAASNSRIKRLYIFQWSGSSSSARFDAGLTDVRFNPRPGYVIVCKHLHAAKCKVKVSKR
jgi:hypothetical protein